MLSLKPLVVDKDTVLLEHFEGATTGKPNRPIEFSQGRLGQGLVLTPHTSVSWDKGPLPEGTFEFWFKLDKDFEGTLASANFSNQPAAITILIQSTGKRELNAELFTGIDWQRPIFSENKIPVNQWNHVAISWGRNGINVFLNGKREGHLVGTHVLNRNTGTWVIGSQIRHDGGGFAGIIDEVRISHIQREFKPEDFTP